MASDTLGSTFYTVGDVRFPTINLTKTICLKLCSMQVSGKMSPCPQYLWKDIPTQMNMWCTQLRRFLLFERIQAWSTVQNFLVAFKNCMGMILATWIRSSGCAHCYHELDTDN